MKLSFSPLYTLNTSDLPFVAKNSYIHEIAGNWKILLPQTQFTGPNIGRGPRPATIALALSDNQWIVGVVDGNFMKMVKLRVTAPNSYDWIATKFIRIGTYNSSCETEFSESCFAGIDGRDGECHYTVDLVAEVDGIIAIEYLLLSL